MSKSHLNPNEFDSRMIEWNLRHSVTTTEKLKAFLDALPDDNSNAELIHIEEDDDMTSDVTEQ